MTCALRADDVTKADADAAKHAILPCQARTKLDVLGTPKKKDAPKGVRTAMLQSASGVR
jgi:hypothetical protein